MVFASDHGDYLGSHGRVQQRDLHEESVRIPYQLCNLAGTGEQAAVAAGLDRRLRAWDARIPWLEVR